eukprot:COSAG01_NODE_4023_length_5426_cov_7.423503_4_plen_784_part_00
MALTSTEVGEEARPHFEAFLKQHKLELEQLKLELEAAGRSSSFKTLITGHGTAPAPRMAAGWLAIADETTPQSSWDAARRDLGLTWWQGVWVSLTKLLLWHFSQPIAYLIIFRGYYCVLSDAQQTFGSVVAAREVLYLATALAAVCACPVFLLIDLSTVWHKGAAGADATVFDRVTRLAMYILTPQNYVAKVLVCRFPNEEEEQEEPEEEPQPQPQPERAVVAAQRKAAEETLKYAALLGFVLAWAAAGLAAAIAPHGRGSDAAWVLIPWALLGAWVAALLGAWTSGSNSLARRAWRKDMGDMEPASMLAGCAIFGVTAGPALWGWLQTTNSQGDGAETPAASGRFGIGWLVLLGTVVSSFPFPLYSLRREYKDHIFNTKALLAPIALAQLIADFASCFALGILLADGLYDDTTAPFALKIGYAVTALGFLLFFGPLGIRASLNAAQKIKGEEDIGRLLCLSFRWRAGTDRAAGRKATCTFCAAAGGGLVLLVGWLYAMIGAFQLGVGVDVFCNGYALNSPPDCVHAINGTCQVSACRCQNGGGNHLCSCDAGWAGANCGIQCTKARPCGYAIVGTIDSGLSGAYGRTTHTCSDKPVYQQGGGEGYVLYTDSAEGVSWEVSTSDHATSCAYDNNILENSHYCDGVPDGCNAGKWKEHGSTNPAVRVVAVHGKACATFQPDCGHGVCVASGNGAHDYHCICDYGWSGAACDHDPCAGVNCTAKKGEHYSGACVRDADALGHTCGCESGYIGEHCAGAFIISGATHSDLNGLYTRRPTLHTCSCV